VDSLGKRHALIKGLLEALNTTYLVAGLISSKPSAKPITRIKVSCVKLSASLRYASITQPGSQYEVLKGCISKLPRSNQGIKP
ncbi:MAG: hypothetical protein KZQ99_19130, partial [Candidatus Thiodiazotropha sp. (ex Dulcina madagascariensis)]|nr:hypothetical protein [Candidatus Thiodiazotropha sp. (ex Dulcina madagascariensis)]